MKKENERLRLQVYTLTNRLSLHEIVDNEMGTKQTESWGDSIPASVNESSPPLKKSKKKTLDQFISFEK